MAEKKITVVIDGQEFVSKAADSAGGAMDGFAGKIPAWGKAIAVATAAFAILSKAVGAVGDYIMASLDSYDAYVSSQVKLAAQSKLTGVSMKDMGDLVEKARKEFGLSTVTAVDLTSAVAKFSSAAGASAKAGGLMSAALELGAASGQSATQVAEGLSSALAGNDEWLNRLGLSNPSVIWEKYRVANGLAKDQMDDTTKALAVMTAIMDAGNIVTGVYAERLESGAGQQEKLNNRIEAAKVAFGEAIQPVRIFALQALTVLVDVLGRVGLAVGRVVNAVGVVLVGSFQLARSAVGSLVEGVGKLTGNKELEAWGAKQSQAFPQFIDQLNKMEKGIAATGDASTKASEKLKTGTKVTEEEIKKQDAAWKQYLKDYEASLKRINDAYDAYLKLLPKLKPALEASMDTTRIEGMNKALQASKETADAAFKAMKDGAEPLPPLIKRAGDTVQDMGDKLGTAAGAVLTVGENFGGLDEEAKNVLTSVQGIAGSVGDLATKGLSFAGVAGVVGGIGAIVSAMMAGDAARKQLLRENNVELARLRDEIGNISLNVTGDDFGKAISTLTDLVPKLKPDSLANFGANSAALASALAKSGMSMTKLEEIAKTLGISLRDKNGNFQFGALKQLLEGLGLVELGQFGKDYASQKESVTAGFGVNGTNDVGQIGALGQLGGQFSSALAGVVDVNDLAGTRTRLQGLFGKLQNGGLTAGELGGLTGTQFLDLITDIIGRIDNLTPNTGGGTVGGDGTGGGTVVTSGGVVVPTKTLSDVLDGVNAQTTALAAYHIKHLDIATAHLDEAKVQTGILMSIAENTASLRDGGVISAVDKGLESERIALAAERGRGGSF